MRESDRCEEWERPQKQNTVPTGTGEVISPGPTGHKGCPRMVLNDNTPSNGSGQGWALRPIKMGWKPARLPLGYVV